MGIGYSEMYLLKQAVLINWIWKRWGEVWFTLSFIASHVKHFKVLNPGLTNKMSLMRGAVIGTILRWYKALKIEAGDQRFLFSSDNHVKSGLKYLCVYMKHERVGETEWDKPLTNN